MRHVQHLSLESLVKMDHFQKEPPLDLKRTTGAQGGTGPGPAILKEQIGIPLRLNVRFGSLADMATSQRDIRVTSALTPQADMERRA